MSAEELPLAGIRVIELGGGLAAGLCTHLLAGYGADVVQVGEPGLTADEDTYLSRGKRRVDAAGAELDSLLAAAEVVIDARARSAPVDPTAEAIRAAHPRLVVTAITPFGLSGPHVAHRSTNIVVFANGGREPDNVRGFMEYRVNLPARRESSGSSEEGKGSAGQR